MKNSKFYFCLLLLIALQSCSTTPIQGDGPITTHNKYQKQFLNEKIPKFSVVAKKAKPKAEITLNKKLEFELKSNSPKLMRSNDNTQFSHYVVLNWKPSISGKYQIEGYSEPVAAFRNTQFNRGGTSHFTPLFFLIDEDQQDPKELKMEYGICDVVCLKVNLKYSTNMVVEKNKTYKLLIVGDTSQENLVITQGSSDYSAGGVIMNNQYSLFSSSHGKINFTISKVE